jgi:hypothetical protein
LEFDFRRHPLVTNAAGRSYSGIYLSTRTFFSVIGMSRGSKPPYSYILLFFINYLDDWGPGPGRADAPNVGKFPMWRGDNPGPARASWRIRCAVSQPYRLSARRSTKLTRIFIDDQSGLEAEHDDARVARGNCEVRNISAKA